MIWFISTVAILFTAAALALPFMRGGIPVISLRRSRMGARRRELREEKAKMILALKELDFDYEMGKLSAPDYKALKEIYEARAIKILKELESVEKRWTDTQKKIDQLLADRSVETSNDQKTGRSSQPSESKEESIPREQIAQ